MTNAHFPRLAHCGIRTAGSTTSLTTSAAVTVLGFLLAFAPAAHGQHPELLHPIGPAPGETADARWLGQDALAKRRRPVSVNFATLDGLRADAGKAPRESRRLTLNLFDDVVFTGIVERRAPTFSGGYSLTGSLAEDPMGSMALVVNGETVAGTVRTPTATYRIRAQGPGRYAVTEIDSSKLPADCGLPLSIQRPGSTAWATESARK